MAKAALIPCFTPEIVEKASCEFHMYCRVEGLRLNCVADFGRSVTIAQAKDEDALFFEVIQELSKNCASKYEMLHRTDNAKNWRYLRTTVVDGQWRYQENASYRYDAIEDTRKVWFEKHIGAMATVFSVQAVAGLISEYTSLLNIQFHDDHWLFDLKRMEFVEISASKERDSAGTEHPQPQEITGIKN